MAIDNHPVVTPLAIVASKIIPSESGPKHMVLVQWRGLPPKETFWEEWQTFKTLHHLEDKVLFDGHGSDMKTTEELQLAREVQEESEARPKRKKAIPLYLEDYICDL